MARCLCGSISKPRPARRAADAVVCVGLAGLADWAGHAQLPLQLVAGVAEARVQQRAPSIRPAVGLARAACDFVRAVALGGHLVVGPAGPARHALPVRVLVGARGLEAPGAARLADSARARLRAHVAHALHLPGAPVRRLARRARIADRRGRVIRGRVQWAYAAQIQTLVCKRHVRGPRQCFAEVHSAVFVFPSLTTLTSVSIHFKPFQEKFNHVQSSGPVPPTAPNEFAVQAVHVWIKLNPILYRLSGQMLQLSPSNANPGAHTHAEALALPVCSVVSVVRYT